MAPRIPYRFHVSVGTLDTGHFLQISSKRLSLSMVTFPTVFDYPSECLFRSEPQKYYYSWFGLLRFRSPLLAKSRFDFSSSPYLDVSVREVPLIHLCIQCMIYDSSPYVFPHSEICGSIAYLQLTAAYRSLSRLSSAPDAKAFSLCSCLLELLLLQYVFQHTSVASFSLQELLSHF